jgi:type I restriction enzyme S subunit
LVNPAVVADGRIKDDPAAKVDQETCKRLSRHILREGDIVFARRGELGRCAVVTPREDGWMCGTGSLRVRLEKAQVDPEFLALYVRYTGAADELVLKSVGSTMDNLNTDILGNLPVVMPPLSEQVGIVHRLHDELRGTVDLTTTLRDSLRLLSERRSALITAAVTGKIAMPGMN